MTISNLNDGDKGIVIDNLEIIYVGDKRAVTTRDGRKMSVMDITVKDSSGSIICPIWDESNQAKIVLGGFISINNGYVTKYNEKLQLNIGKYGTFEIANGPVQTDLIQDESNVV